MKQFIRYLLLIACVMVIGVWVWSTSHVTSIVYGAHDSYGVRIVYGSIMLQHGYGFNYPEKGFQSESESLPPGYVDDPLQHRLGMILPWVNHSSDSKGKPFFTTYTIPFWLLFTPLFLLTLKLWYHPIKNWWRGTNKQGFDVELVDKQDESAKSA